MTTWIALFRGINVGGKNVLPMAALRSDLETLSLTNVRTYIQSGNVVFESRAKSANNLSKKMTEQISKNHGFTPDVIVFTSDDLQTAIDNNPFPEGTEDPKTLHFFFLSRPAKSPDRDAIEKAARPSERFLLTERVFYLHAPDGIGRSKLAASVEKFLGVAVTARNYRTVDQLITMIN
ncbi:MAG: DUF1697 domain-containing protein [Planctomycetota bacterium]